MGECVDVGDGGEVVVEHAELLEVFWGDDAPGVVGESLVALWEC